LKIIKLDATDSTNTFLKELAQNSPLENYTTVVAREQNLGRGQMNNSWLSEPSKNLTFSIFNRFKRLPIEHQSYLNFSVSLALLNTLKEMSVPNLKVKWPNDIMSGNQKICGILVETTFKNLKIKNTVIGIGLNVHQEEFPSHISNASSLKNILHQEFDLDSILVKIVENIKVWIEKLENNQLETIDYEYHQHLYKKNVPTAFKNEKTELYFMGIIQGVSPQGNLRIQLEDDSIAEYSIKEVSLAKV